MKKETKIIIGIGGASILGYLYWKKSKKSKKFSFAQSDYNSCVADGNQPSDCCAKLGGTFSNGICGGSSPKVPPNTGGIKCPEGTVVNGLCVDTQPPPTPPPPPPNPTPTPTPTPTSLPPLMGVPIVPIVMPMPPMYPIGSSGDASGGQEEKKEFDWIPYILGGMTIALSLVSEN